jgi:hypothetical protein
LSVPRPQITEADRSAFDVARRLTFGGSAGKNTGDTSAKRSRAASLQSRLSRESGDASMPGSIGRTLFNDGDGGEEEEAIIPPVDLPDPLLQLDEQAEPRGRDGVDEAIAADASPASSIDIKTFKVLGLIRELASVAGEGGGSTITTFGDLSAQCSRGTTARMFYHVASLATNRFLCVTQAAPYGPIALSRGENF